MKKITLVIFTAFFALNCSKDDSSLSNEELKLSELSNDLSASKSQLNYEIVDIDFKSVGEISIYHDETSIYMICKTDSDHFISEAGFHFGSFSTIPKDIKPFDSNSFTNYSKFENSQQEHIFKFDKKNLKFDKNGCVYVATHFQLFDSNSEETKLGFSVSQILPGSLKTPYFLYSIQ